MKLAISIDPGGTSGFTAFNVPDGMIDPETYSIHTALEVAFCDRFWFGRFLTQHRDVIGLIILERFKLFDNAKTMKGQINSEFPSVRIIGIVETYAYINGLLDLIRFQEPNDRLSTKIPSAHYKALGPSNHIRDAYRHWRYYALTHRRHMI